MSAAIVATAAWGFSATLGNASDVDLPRLLQQDDDGWEAPVIRLAQAPLDPAQPVAPRINTDPAALPNASPKVAATTTGFRPSGSLFGPIANVDIGVGASAAGPVTDIVPGIEAIMLRTRDVGGLAFQSKSTNGISAHQRNAVTSDIRVRGYRAGQNIGAGSYWNPGRPDLDTALNKIFSYNVDHLVVVKGPYAINYGPGFNFIDMQLLQSPRYADGPGWNGTTSLNYETNGEIWYGREHLWGGGEDWGARVSYGHGTGNDYEDGEDVLIPNSFKSRDLYATIGRDLSEHQSIEFSYIRLDQTDVEFPGLVYDINWLVTDGFELEYLDTESPLGDVFRAEAWYNRTRFEGDTLRASKNRQIPQLRNILSSPDGQSGFAITDVDGSSVGYRLDWTWEQNSHAVRFGTDLIYLDTTLNDIEPLSFPFDNNFPVPHSNSADIGIFADYTETVTDQLSVTLGGRADLIQTRSSEFVEGVPLPTPLLLGSELDQSFTLWGAFLTADYAIDPNWALNGGVGFAQRPPSLVEMYALGSFIGTLQQGLTFVQGDPQLNPERLRQIDLSLAWDYDRFGGRLSGFYSWIDDYITYDLTTPPASQVGGLSQGVAYVNTDLATISGFELASHYDLSASWSLFGKMFYVEGRDRMRSVGARLQPGPRSGLVGRGHEPLPGISPLEALVGVRWHDPSPDNLWGVELAARIVDNQDRIAESLSEIATPGFTVWNVHSYWQLTDNVLFLTGVQNLTDKFYREHLDYRSGLGVFQRGVSFYFGTDISY
jgi:outer membrane receptor protein involved in Fe transport